MLQSLGRVICCSGCCIRAEVKTPTAVIVSAMTPIDVKTDGVPSRAASAVKMVTPIGPSNLYIVQDAAVTRPSK